MLFHNTSGKCLLSFKVRVSLNYKRSQDFVKYRKFKSATFHSALFFSRRSRRIPVRRSAGKGLR
jgi:hypothetical protein